MIGLSFKEWLVEAEATPYKIEKLPSGLLAPKPVSLFRGPKEEQFPKVCISGFAKHQDETQKYARANDENFAQTLIFSMLTANRGFPTLFGYFPILVSILRTAYSNRKVDPKDLFHISLGISRNLREMLMLVNSGSAKYIAKLWNNRSQIKAKLDSLAKKEPKDLVGMLAYLTSLKAGLGNVKGAFAIQLAYGELACMDTHNVRVYSNLAKTSGMFDDKTIKNIEGAMKFPATGKGAALYYDTIKTIMDKFGMQSQHFWDLWTDYVVRQPMKGAKGPSYAMKGPALNPFDDVYQRLLHILAKKYKGGEIRGREMVATGYPGGYSGSLAHLVARTKGAEEFKPGPKGELPEIPGEEWRDVVTKFSMIKHPAYQLATQITTPQGIEELRKQGERSKEAGDRQKMFF